MDLGPLLEDPTVGPEKATILDGGKAILYALTQTDFGANFGLFFRTKLCTE